MIKSRRSKIAVSAVIGTVIMFAMLLSVAGSYFYFIQQDQAQFQKAVDQSNNNLLNDQSAEHLSVYGISQSGELAFYINNTGIAISIVSYWVLNGQTGAVLQYENTTSDSANLPLLVGQGQSKTLNATQLTPNIEIPVGSEYVIKVLTSRGTQGVGTYPSQQLTSATVNSLVAGGFGSLEMTFSSFNWYSYLSGPSATTTFNVGGTPTTFNNLCATSSEKETNCNGGSYVLDMSHPHSGSLVPGGYNATDTFYSTTTSTSTLYSSMSVDGSNTAETTTGASSISTTLTTSNAKDVIIAYVSVADTGNNNPPSATISGGSLTWNQRALTSTYYYSHSGSYTVWEYEFYAVTSSKLSSASIKASFSPSFTAEAWITVFGISGANTGTPFDPNNSIPATNSGSNPQTTISTSNSNDMLLYSCAPSSGQMANGFTSIESNQYTYQDSYTGYETVTTTQSNDQISCGGYGADGVEITDAVQAASSGTSTLTSTSTSTTFQYFQVPAAFSVNITNDDPSLGTIIINSASNLWVIETCDSGTAEGNCPSGNPFFVYYIMNVNPATGAVTSQAAGSFAEIVIPYGVTKTLYYGAAYDLSMQNFSPVGLTSAFSDNPYYYGQFSVFLLFAGTKIISPTVLVYGQNIPFESTTAADNFGWISETPATGNAGVPNTFTLYVNDSIFAYANPNNPVGISTILVNASSFSSVSASAVSGWTITYPQTGYIQWQAKSASNYITNGTTVAFTWTGTAPSPSSSTTYIFPITVTWDTGEITSLQAALACTIA